MREWFIKLIFIKFEPYRLKNIWSLLVKEYFYRINNLKFFNDNYNNLSIIQ